MSRQTPVFLPILATLVACAAPTTSAPSGYNGTPGAQRIGEGRFFVEVSRRDWQAGRSKLAVLHQRAAQVCSNEGYPSYEIEDRSEDRSVRYDYRENEITNSATVQRRDSVDTVSAVVQCTGEAATAVAGAPGATPRTTPAAAGQAGLQDAPFARYDRFDDKTFLGWCAPASASRGEVVVCAGWVAPGEHTWEERHAAPPADRYSVSFDFRASVPGLDSRHDVTILVDARDRVRPAARYQESGAGQQVWIELSPVELAQIASAEQVEIRVGNVELALHYDRRAGYRQLVERRTEAAVSSR